MDLLRDIALFVEVARTRNFRLAASNLDMPGSSLSRRIAALEKALGMPLLTRTTRKVELTDAGRQYYQHCLGILEQSQLAIDELRQQHSQPGGLIRVSMPVDFGLLFMPRVLDTFCAQYPQIRFELDLSPRRVDMLSEGFDLALRIGEVQEPHLITRRINVFDIGLYAAPAYIAKHGMPRMPADLSRHQCLRINEQPWRLQRMAGRKRSAPTGTSPPSANQSVPVSGQICANNPGMLRRLALLGLGIFSGAELMLQEDLRSGALVRLLPGWCMQPLAISAVMQSRQQPARVRLFLDHMIACCQREQTSRRK
jgi:DNA-binding transcriptional LysR family regulator